MLAIDAYIPEELLAVTLARLIRDGEVVGTGAKSAIPAAAALLAKATHAPNVEVIIMGSRDLSPFAEGTREFFDFVQAGRLDLSFVSGAQIDRHGNLNLHVVGEYEHPRVRFPGDYGIGLTCAMAKRCIAFRARHTKRIFVEKVDFVTAPGRSPSNAGAETLVTPLAQFEWDVEASEWVMASLAPNVLLEHVQENTGWDVRYRKPLFEYPAPTAEELAALRGPVREQVAGTYPEFAARIGDNATVR